MDCQRTGLLPREFDALDRHKILWLLLHCIAKLPPKPKKVLALYYHEDFSLADIATGFGLAENEIDQMRARTLRVLQMMLTTQLSAALPRKGSAKQNDRSERVKGKSHFRRQKRSNRRSDELTKQRERQQIGRATGNALKPAARLAVGHPRLLSSLTKTARLSLIREQRDRQSGNLSDSGNQM